MTVSVTHTVVTGAAADPTALVDGPAWDAAHTITGLAFTDISGTATAAQGGTGQSSYVVGDILYASTTSALSNLAGVATGNALISGGVTTAPSWGKIALTTHISGTLGVTNGGTGTATQFTQGSVVFAGASGVYTQDNANLFWDDTNNRLGIGTASPQNLIHILQNNSAGLNQFKLEQSDVSGTASANFIFLITGTQAWQNGVYGSDNSFRIGSSQSATWANTWFKILSSGATTLSGDVTFALSARSTSATAGVGYATGAGGAVTQATSRTTGVTLNKVCGAITLVSAAGSASYQTFTVTNSAVAATDVVTVNQKSGTDLNEILVTAVAAGSFNITFRTTGGTTTEQPVFNFAVVKAVAA